MELWPRHHRSEQEQLSNTVQALGRLYGIDGLEVQVSPGAGWSCAKTEQGLLITADPQQTIEGNGQEQTVNEEAEPLSPELTSLFITAHELGHASDMLDPRQPALTEDTKAGHFFRRLVDDTVIDKRSRRIPLFNANADAVYAKQMPADLTKMPKHVQLMYALRIGTVSNLPVPAMDEKVAETVEGIRSYVKNGETIDIMEALVDPRTSLRDRRLIAQRYIRPQFEALLAEDKEEQKQKSGDSGDGQGDFDEAYQEYENAAHGHRSKEHEEGKDASGRTQQSDDGKELSKQMAKAIKQTRKEQEAEQQSQSAANGDQNSSDKDETARMSELAGSLAAELELRPADAAEYAKALKKYKPIIREVANVLMQLSAPSEAIMSPRYRIQARTEGHRLHPRTMARVALQQASDQKQAIWQPIERRAQRQELDFGGLDIHLLLDVSGSMDDGVKSVCAANTGLCLTEGVQFARYEASRRAGQSRKPDVRTQLIAFGSRSKVLSPLQHEPTGPQKGAAYSNLLHPNSGSTHVNGALQEVSAAVQAAPNRDHVVVIVSDGSFDDASSAARTVAMFPENVLVTQLMIDGVTRYITPHHENLDRPEELPQKLYGILASRIQETR